MISKSLHVTTVIVSLVLFNLRAYWFFRSSELLHKRWVKVLPHINDTILLISAIWMAVSIGQYPFVHHWISAKVLALLGYIFLGMFALHWAKQTSTQIIFWLLANVTFVYIVSVAIYKNPLGFLALI